MVSRGGSGDLVANLIMGRIGICIRYCLWGFKYIF